jgi:hypothetical protein
MFEAVLIFSIACLFGAMWILMDGWNKPSQKIKPQPLVIMITEEWEPDEIQQDDVMKKT